MNFSISQYEVRYILEYFLHRRVYKCYLIALKPSYLENMPPILEDVLFVGGGVSMEGRPMEAHMPPHCQKTMCID